MNIQEIIRKKQEKKELNKEEIEYFIDGYTNGKIPDYQASALVMAIFLNGMTNEETTNLTIAMANSGEIMDLSSLNEIIVDKHSSGGVGDKVSICLLPIVASLGVKVAKMSGRGLGFTGGTADKLEAIPGFNINIETQDFINNVKKIGICMATQTKNLAPADKKLYALRDTISCTESIPLIASSIMSKKIASGAQKNVLDITVGDGAFMKTKEQAKNLSRTMIDIGKLANRETICILTNMDEPLGYAVGNSLEVIEAVEFLKGNMPEDLKQVVLELGSYMIKLAGLGDNIKENKNKMLININNGKAYNKFLQMVKNQNGDISYIEDTEKFEKTKYIEEIKSSENGYISEIKARQVGEIVGFLGAGRMKIEDKIDHSVGVVFNKKVSDKVNIGDTLCKIYSNDIEKMEKAKQKLQNIIKISKQEIKKPEIILEIIK